MKHGAILRPEPLGVRVAPVSRCDLRVGAVSYLNTKPLIFGLQSLAPLLRVQVAPPAELALGLREGRLDVALVPVLEYFSRPDYGLISESAICGDGRVRSVLLFSRVPIEQVRSVSLDPESLTTNALLRVLCRRRFAIEPECVARSPQSDPSVILERGETDAAVVIGNLALAMSGHFEHEYDFGQEWWHLTGLPFVFAVWAVRPGTEVGDLPEVLRQSLRLGLAHLELIANDAARTLGLDPGLCLNYLRAMIRYEMTDRAWQGMARFFAMCVEMAICPPLPPRDLARKAIMNYE
jgi:chorismate dehydratase